MPNNLSPEADAILTQRIGLYIDWNFEDEAAVTRELAKFPHASTLIFHEQSLAHRWLALLRLMRYNVHEIRLSDLDQLDQVLMFSHKPDVILTSLINGYRSSNTPVTVFDR